MRTILPHDQNPALRATARSISIDEIKSEYIQTLISEMKQLLAKENFGVALAAPQLGEPVKLFLVSGRALARNKRNSPDEPGEESEKKDSGNPQPDQIYINPELVKMSRGKKEKHEGCLSVRGYWGIVPRAEKATVHAYDEHAREFTRGASGFLAHIFQHEMDHLEGILYTDKATEVYEDSEKDDSETHAG